MSLAETASKIIEQKAHTEDDITELQRIKWRMVLLYDEAVSISWLSEELYNSIRSNKYIEVKTKTRGDGKRFTDNEADRISKQEAEDKYWNYRTAKAKAMGMQAKIKAISDFCVDYYTRRKSESIASNTT